MKKNICFLLCFLLMTGLVSCDIPAHDPRISSLGEIEQQYQAVSALLTQTAQVPQTSTISTVVFAKQSTAAGTKMKPTATRTLAVYDVLPTALISTPTPVIGQPDGKALAAPCDLAQLGFPIDITVPDGTHFQPGEYFSKTWRLYNAGSCRWTRDYAIVWFSGSNMAIYQSQPLSVEVLPGASVDITVDMVAPLAAGTYQSNWKLRNHDGSLFGIGPSGDAPFWVRIVVVPVDTPTPTQPAVDATPTPIVYASGTLTLASGEGIDLDSAQINQAENDDLRFDTQTADGAQLTPLTSAHLVTYGVDPPHLLDCDRSATASAPVGLVQEQVGAYLCYRTTKGLPGWVNVKSIDLEKGQVDLEFVTWAVP